MSSRCVQVTAPARIHFGMLSFGNPGRRQFGGVGAMVSQPATCVTLSAAADFHTNGILGDRVRQYAAAWSARRRRDKLPPCRIAVCQSPETHTGVGTGTQLGLAVVAGLNALLLPEAPRPSAAELAASAGRGLRSAVGTYGFQRGGLIFEPGKRSDEPIAPLTRRVPLPTGWRFLLLRRGTGCGLSGDVEKRAFDRLPPVPPDVTRQLTRLAGNEILPAAEAGRFDEFAEAVYKYGYLAGECFAPIQGSAFASREIAELVQTLRDWGVRGVGQSSWGPTVFAVLPDSAAAQALEARLRRTYAPDDLSLTSTAADNSGARIEIS